MCFATLACTPGVVIRSVTEAAAIDAIVPNLVKRAFALVSETPSIPASTRTGVL